MLDDLCSIGGSHQPLTFVIVEGVSIRVDKAMLPHLRTKEWQLNREKRAFNGNKYAGKVLQMHKFVAMMGKVLPKSSKQHSIHHANDNRHDNRLCNLKVYRSFKEHRAAHHKKKGKKKGNAQNW